ncbi:hypothetical protein ASE14_05285 [Agromyces sp. Root81]|uniref:DUF5719 family protein n=1 Tax=Agromyces sp. Root81 TaxID=1736601 RepID=UPI0006F9B39B|nr:DUF5719 family protein [Agromyces sp. Root81]KRC60436.1 hypothetical protein ASE14_05285 [Agromyces sp. Root81]
MPADRNVARTIARVGGRAAGFLVAAALAAAALGAAALVPWPEQRVTPPSLVVQPAESRQQRVCPGPLLTLADDAAAATTASSIGSADVVFGADPDDVEITETPLATPGNPRADRDGTPVVLAVEPGSVGAGLLAGAQSQSADTETITGFAAASCAEAAAESWLVAGSTTLGRTSLVSLANPTDVAATVDVRVIGEAGAIEAGSALGIIVPAGSQRVVSLAGLAPNVASPVVHVTSTGGTIAAALEQSAVDGLAPAGVEFTGVAAMPANSQVIPGFVVAESGGVDPTDDHAEGDDFPAVRLLATGDEPVDVSIGVVPEAGASGSTIETTLQPGRATDVPLGVLDAGVYTVRLDADGPIVAAARATTAAAAGATQPGDADAASSGDFAWFASTAPLLEAAVIAVPDGPSPMLHLANEGEDAAEVQFTIDGQTRAVTIDAGSAASVEVDEGAIVSLAGVAGVHASVSFSGEGELAAFGAQPPGPLDSPIRVFPR